MPGAHSPRQSSSAGRVFSFPWRWDDAAPTHPCMNGGIPGRCLTNHLVVQQETGTDAGRQEASMPRLTSARGEYPCRRAVAARILR